MYLKYILTLLLFVKIGGALAQKPTYQFSHLTVRDGLPHNQINCVYKDDKGFIWFGTMAGLARFDGYSFKVYQHKAQDSTALADNDIRNITEGPNKKLWITNRVGIQIYDPVTDKFDRATWNDLQEVNVFENPVRAVNKDQTGHFWFTSNNTGIYHYNTQTGKTSFINHVMKDEKSISATPVVDLAVSATNDIWIIHADGLLEQVDRNTRKVAQRLDALSKLYKAEKDTYKLFIDRQGLIWIYDSQSSMGLFCYDPITRSFTNINRTSSPLRLNSTIISGIIQDKDDKIWIATDHGGLNVINKKRATVEYILNSEDSDKSINQNNLSSIYSDNLGTIWVGTYKRGVNYYHPGIIKFGLIRHSNPGNSMVYNDVNDLVEDRLGNIWMATNGRGLTYYNRKTGSFRSFRHDPANRNSISHDAVVGLYLDKEDKLWIGTYSGGLDCFDGRNFTHFKNNPSDSYSISDNRICNIFEDSSNRFWVLTMGGGINLFDKASQKFKSFSVQSRHLQSNYVFAALEDSKKNLWFGTGYGLAILPHKSGKFTTIINTTDDDKGLVNNSINCLREDKKGNIWIGTREGLSIYNPLTKKYNNFTMTRGLPDNNILELEFDRFDNCWISTSNGLSKATIKYQGAVVSLIFKNFDESDGLQGKEFNRNASLRLRSGELAFGGSDGVNIFNPAHIRTNNNPSHLLITGFQLFNQPVNIGESVDGDVILKQTITTTKEITLKSYQNVFSIEFASLNYIEPHKVKHQYMMQGFDKTWITADNNIRKATYTNLDAGNYVFKVRASNTDGAWTEKPVELAIRVLPPFYKSTWAYVIYLIAFVSGLLMLRQRGIQRLKMQFAAEQEKKEVKRLIEEEKVEAMRLIEQERLEAMRAHELDALKIKFLTNISHEFRTPLSLILAPIEKLLKQTADNIQANDQVSLIQRNARRLLNLVNQLLDFRRMELNELKLHKRSGNIVKFVKDIALSFKDIAEQKNIQLSFNSVAEEINTTFDEDKVERILFNLLSNAFKFTLENGKVNVSIDLSENKELVEIKVRDTGIGIAKEKQERIFDSFFQSDIPESIINQGSGIGLSIAKEFARLHGGEIYLESGLNFGSCFTVQLPVEELQLEERTEEAVDEIIVDEKLPEQLMIQADTEVSIKKLTILIVEDDVDFRFYLKDNLRESFNVIEAGNGKDGWQKALFYHPNIIVSDISMPEMNGIELCKKVKSDNRTFHIPIILLTAISGEESQIAGLGSGANDYMTKPFSFEILNSKIRNILRQQESFRKTYQKQVEIKPAAIEIESPDEKFLQEVIKIVEKNISNSNFSVDELSTLLFVSRVTLYKRIVNLTGKTPLEFIKSYRLKRATQLLEKGDFTISQVCYKVGFKTPKNFVKSFKAEFDVIPSKYTESREAAGNTVQE